VKNPNSLPRTTPRERVNRPDSIDAVFAMGGLTGTDGHPAGVMKRNIGRGNATAADTDGAFYHQVDSRGDLDRKWPLLLAAKPDFIKTYLLYSEEYAQRRNDPTKYAWKGLDPKLLPEIVRRAHAAGLRVTTHVETATDFHHAIGARVDEIAHLPGFRSDGPYEPARFRISDADAKQAARRGIVVVTTVGATLAQNDAVVNQTIAANLRTLRRHRVKLAIGSDDYRGGVLPEAAQLRTLGIFTDAELLDLWTRATAQSIFRTRKLGRLAPRYEASFLVLEGNPLADFANTGRIRMRVKRGVTLPIAPSPQN
jgi:Amidohydrolase family